MTLSTPTLHIEATYAAVADFLSLPPVDYSIQNVSSLEQLKKLWKLDMQAYQDCTIPFSIFKKWWSAYPFGSVIYLENNEILASIGLYPIEQTMAEAFIAGKIPEAELVPVRLKECQRHPQQYWYASGILLNDRLLAASNRMLRDHPVKPLLQNGLELWLNSGHVAYPAKLFALGLTQEGINMLRRFGFAESKPAAEMPDHCALYEFGLSSRHQASQGLRGRSLHDTPGV